MLFIKLLKVVFLFFCIFKFSIPMYIFYVFVLNEEKTPKRLHTKEQSLLFPEIDGCLWGNPACNFQNLQVHCKLNHVASTQIILFFQNHSSKLPISLFPWIFLRWPAPTKPQACTDGPDDGPPVIWGTPFITEASPWWTPISVSFTLFILDTKFLNKKGHILQQEI